jgi:threonine aldolase
MTDTANLADAPNRCDVVDDQKAPEKGQPFDFCVFLSRLTAEQTVRRTADYINDPEAYLRKSLGPETFEKRKDFLSIPPKFDKDIYGNGEHKTHFQQHIAKLFGKDHGLFFVTGIQAQLAALKVHCERAGNNRVAWHATSHLETAELSAFDKLYGMERILIGKNENENPSVDDFKEILALPEAERPAAILLEIPNRVLGCRTYTFDELKIISDACKEAGVKFHCDGARIWEIEPYYRRTANKSFGDVANLFDSLYTSFYKGIRGVTGAMLVCNDESFINEAKAWQRRAGGNAFTLFYETIDCERGFNENIGSFEAKWNKFEEIAEAIMSATSKYRTSSGKPVVQFSPEKPVCCQARTIVQGYPAEQLLAARDRVLEKKNVKVFDRLFPKKPLDKYSPQELEAWIKTGDPNSGKEVQEEDLWHIIEWMVVDDLMRVDANVFADGYVALCEELEAGSA